MNTIRVLLFILLALTTTKISTAQNTEFVSDGFNDVANWCQDRKNFVDGDLGYISDTSTTYGTDIIYRPVDNLYLERGDIGWIIAINKNFNISSVNNFQFILSANHESTDYDDFEGFGIATGQKPTYSALSFVKYSGGKMEVLYCGESKLESDIITVRRTQSGQWYIGETEVYQDANKFYDSKYIITKFKFNKTGAGKFGFKFENIVQTDMPVELMSTLDSANILDVNTFRVYYNGRLGAQDCNGFLINGDKADKVTVSDKYIDVTVNKDMDLSTNQTITINGIKDIYGNSVNDFSYTYHGVGKGQVIINEIMADVSNTQDNLQQTKYIEFFNRGESDISLKGFSLVVGKDSQTFGDVMIKSDGYIVVSADELDCMTDGDIVMNVASKLTQSGKYIALLDTRGSVVDSITYSTKLYNDSQRDDGGYSIERVSPESSEYWKASQDESGGTPGRKNSVFTDLGGSRAPGSNEILISELMFAPKDGMPQYVELYNNSDYSILLDGITLTYKDSTSDYKKSVTITGVCTVPARGYVVITSDSTALQAEYECGGTFIETSKYPNMDAEEGCVVITDKDGTVLDSVYYSTEMHSMMVSFTQGISLERRDFSTPATDTGNWISGSECSPGLKNTTEYHESEDDGFTVDHQLLRPGDSDCEYTLTFLYPDPETVVDVQIFDNRSRRVNAPAVSRPVSYGDKVTWNGLDYSQNRCRVGIYAVLITVYFPNGKIKNYKRACVVGRQ